MVYLLHLVSQEQVVVNSTASVVQKEELPWKTVKINAVCVVGGIFFTSFGCLHHVTSLMAIFLLRHKTSSTI